jgi:hypothetical protein
MRRALATAVVGVVLLSVARPGADAYKTAVERWRADREAALKTDDGWLTVAGLFWLKPGLNRAGVDPSNDIVLPEGAAPARLGAFEFDGARAIFQAEPGTGVHQNGVPIERVEMNVMAPPTRIQVRDLTMFVIRRGDRVGVRLRDRNNAMRREFKGLRWYPIDPAYRVVATFVPYPEPKAIPVPNVLGDTPEMTSPGYVEFTLGGRALRLDPVFDGDETHQLFFIFGDQTNGIETYPSGRFLYAALPEEGRVVLDFNQAENPPCAFTPFATCPLPPKQNRLPMRVTAGELSYGHH